MGKPVRVDGWLGFRGQGEVNRGLRQVESSLRQPDELERVGSGDCHAQRPRLGEADVLAREDHHSPGDSVLGVHGALLAGSDARGKADSVVVRIE